VGLYRLHRSSPLYRPRPDPHLVLMRWGSEPHPDSPFGPGDSLSWHEFLDPVLPDDPSAHPRRADRGADRELAQLLRLEAPWLPKGDAFGHSIRVSNVCSS
jgi:hypothetical protein